MINNLGTQSYELQINFGVLQIDTENSATGRLRNNMSAATAYTLLYVLIVRCPLVKNSEFLTGSVFH